jgi:hypothetical protein
MMSQTHRMISLQFQIRIIADLRYLNNDEHIPVTTKDVLPDGIAEWGRVTGFKPAALRLKSGRYAFCSALWESRPYGQGCMFARYPANR